MLIPGNAILSSDTHFGDKNIYKFVRGRKQLKSKQTSVEEEVFNRIWKKDPSVPVFLLGDFAFNGLSNYVGLFKQKGISDTIFLPGNHDKASYSSYEKNLNFSVVKGVYLNGNKLTHINYSKYPFLNAIIQDINGVRIMFSHFPVFDFSPHDKEKEFYRSIKVLEELYRRYNCELNIHGHTHNKNSNYNHSVNVCFDVNFESFELKDILNEFINFKNKKYGNIPQKKEINNG